MRMAVLVHVVHFLSEKMDILLILLMPPFSSPANWDESGIFRDELPPFIPESGFRCIKGRFVRGCRAVHVNLPARGRSSSQK